MHVLQRAPFLPLIKPGRVLLASRGIAMLAAIVLAFSVPIAIVIASAASHERAFAAEIATRDNGLHLLSYVRVFERRLRSLRATAVSEHRLDTPGRAAVERALLRLQDATSAADGSNGIASRLKNVSRTWARVADRRQALRDLDATVAAATDFSDAVARHYALGDGADDATSNAAGILTGALPALDERVDQARNLAAGAIAAKRMPGTTKFAVALLNEQRSRIYAAAISYSERYRLETGTGRILDALRRAGYAASRFDAAVAYALGHKKHGRADRVRIAQRAGDVARALDAASGVASAAASAGFASAARIESENFDRTRTLALCAWLAGVALTLVTSLGIYRRERAAGVERYGGVVERLAMTQSQLASVFENSPLGVAVVDGKGAIVRRNASLANLVDKALVSFEPDERRLSEVPVRNAIRHGSKVGGRPEMIRLSASTLRLVLSARPR